ncbi:MAG: oxidase [Pseudohongiella sp.]|nr:MAG: oxidase [Pseudohongiella sp.]
MARQIMMTKHHRVANISDNVAYGLTKCLRFVADTFFARRYGHRAVVLETVAAVPGMVGGMIRHMRSLRRLERDDGWIRRLLDEAQNERMHLMIFLEIAKPTWAERFLVLIAQGFFFTAFTLLYIVSPRTAHRLVGYFEEEAVVSYTEYLAEIDDEKIENTPAPQLAIDYYKLDSTARLREVVLAVRDDEMGHRDVNHDMADELTS